MTTSAILAPDPLAGEALPMAAKPLDKYRLERFMSVVEFCEFLGVSPHTYYRMVRPKEGEQVNFSTMRKVARRLKVQPAEIAEFARIAGTENTPGGEA